MAARLLLGVAPLKEAESDEEEIGAALLEGRARLAAEPSDPALELVRVEKGLDPVVAVTPRPVRRVAAERQLEVRIDAQMLGPPFGIGPLARVLAALGGPVAAQLCLGGLGHRLEDQGPADKKLAEELVRQLVGEL